MVQSPSRESNRFSASQEIAYILWNPKVNYLGPCHHGMARPQVADGRMVSNMEDKCEHAE